MDLQEQNRLDIRGMKDMSAMEEQIQGPFLQRSELAPTFYESEKPCEELRTNVE